MLRRLRPAAWVGLAASVLLMFFVTLVDRSSATRALYLVPFKSFTGIVKVHGIMVALSQACGNILLFLPIGFFLPMVSRIKPWLSVVFCTAISLFVELCQLSFRIGVADVDDLIFNTLGGIFGVILFIIAKKALKRYEKRQKHRKHKKHHHHKNHK